MLVRLVLWNLADSLTTVEELRNHLREATEPSAEGLLFRAAVSDASSERFGALELWVSEEAAAQELLPGARELIGKEPDLVDVFDLESTTAVAPELDGLGLAFA